ncbi:hypothetical protein Q2K19_32150 [Micromonospora soli]|uniref:hypothetical protein n=1 Tax=Micromonospora sp. NBRC 110009 TaxID=3061627 RepID=UPI0026728D44|nr:hypothetical protein [Micromonospora sp. NBRC 110009]WKT98737.1 hypothetical protein Q2K19_32150 [Micromonospora sp. NBRC 110009]
MPPCLDVYVWVPGCEPDVFRAFVDRYVDVDDPGDERLHSFMRTYITGSPHSGDAEALQDLDRSADAGSGFSLYIRARNHYQAIITVTRDGASVLGLSLDDPDNSAQTLEQATDLLGRLRQEFSSPAGVAGVELPPAQSREEWNDDALVQLRVGELPEDMR